MMPVTLTISSGPTTQDTKVQLNGQDLVGVVTKLSLAGEVGQPWSTCIAAYVQPEVALELEAAGVSIFNVNPALRSMLADLVAAAEGPAPIDSALLIKAKSLLAAWQ